MRQGEVTLGVSCDRVGLNVRQHQEPGSTVCWLSAPSKGTRFCSTTVHLKQKGCSCTSPTPSSTRGHTALRRLCNLSLAHTSHRALRMVHSPAPIILILTDPLLPFMQANARLDDKLLREKREIEEVVGRLAELRQVSESLGE